MYFNSEKTISLRLVYENMKFKNAHLEVVAKADNPKEVDLLMYGIIGDWWESQDDNPLTDVDFAKTFRGLERKYDKINVHINSPGGSISAGLAIFNTIKFSAKEVHTYIDGIVASMAAIIALAGRKVHAASNSIYMLHTASGLARGNAETMRETAGVLDVFDSSIIKSVAGKTGMTEEEVQAKWFDYKDHFMTAQEAHELKLIDIVEDYTVEGVPDTEGKSSKDLFDLFNEKEEEMNLKETWNSIKSFFTGETVTEEGMEAVNSRVAELEAENTSLKSGDAEMRSQIDALNTTVTEKEGTISGQSQEIENLKAQIADLTAKLPITALNNGGDNFGEDADEKILKRKIGE